MHSVNGFATWTPSDTYQPGTSIDELSEIMRSIPRGKKIKAGGSRHSQGAGATNGVYISPEKMGFIQPLGGNLVRVGSGTVLQTLNATLWDLGLGMPALGGYDGQTIAGVINTGTHGGVLSEGSLDSRVRSMDIVLADGSQVRIEPTGGMTNREAFLREHPRMRLIQNDRYFNATVLGMGSHGVVHSYVLEAVPRFHAKETMKRTTLDEMLPRLSSEKIYTHASYHWTLLFDPMSGEALEVRTEKTTLEKEPANFGDPGDDDLCVLNARGDAYTRQPTERWFLAHLAPQVGALTNMVNELIPEATRALIGTSLAEEEGYTQRFYNVTHQGVGSGRMPTLFGSYYVPIKGDAWIEAAGIIQRASRKFRDRYGDIAVIVNARPVKASKATLAPHEDYMSFEVMLPGKPDKAPAYLNFLRQEIDREMGGRFWMHLGQYEPGRSVEDTLREYPGYWDFRAVHDELDPYDQFISSPLFPKLPKTKSTVPLDALVSPSGTKALFKLLDKDGSRRITPDEWIGARKPLSYVEFDAALPDTQHVQRAEVRAQRILQDADVRESSWLESVFIALAAIILGPLWLVWMVPGFILGFLTAQPKIFTWYLDLVQLINPPNYAEDAVEDEREFDKRALA